MICASYTILKTMDKYCSYETWIQPSWSVSYRLNTSVNLCGKEGKKSEFNFLSCITIPNSNLSLLFSLWYKMDIHLFIQIRSHIMTVHHHITYHAFLSWILYTSGDADTLTQGHSFKSRSEKSAKQRGPRAIVTPWARQLKSEHYIYYRGVHEELLQLLY